MSFVSKLMGYKNNKLIFSNVLKYPRNSKICSLALQTKVLCLLNNHRIVVKQTPAITEQLSYATHVENMNILLESVSHPLALIL
jgi:hypothetical protein